MTEVNDKKASIENRKCTTPKFRASYANVFKPTSIQEGQEKKYNITMLFDKNDDLTSLKTAVNAAAVEAWGADRAKWPKKRRMPFRDGSAEKPGNKEYAGKIFVYASSKDAPGVVDQRKKPITAESGEFYSGCYGRATLIAFHYSKMGNEGISFALQNVQKWSDGVKLAGKRSAAEDFDDELEDEGIAELDDDFLGEND